MNTSYIGKRNSRDIPSDIYISDRSSVEKKTIINEYAFVSQGFEFATNVGNIDQIPVSVHRTSTQATDNFDEYVNYYNYQAGDFKISDFSVGQCFEKWEKMDIRVTFPYEGN